MRISDWSSDVCSSDLDRREGRGHGSDMDRGLRHVAADRHGEPQADIGPVGAEVAPCLRRELGKAQQVGLVAGDQDVVDQGSAGREAAPADNVAIEAAIRSEEHTSELQSLMRISYAVFCLK